MVNEYDEIYDEDGYEGEEDRLRLQQLSEAEREMILFMRFQERDKKRKMNERRAQKEQQALSEKNGRSAKASTSAATSSRSSSKTTGDLGTNQARSVKALSELSAKRKQDRESQLSKSQAEQKKESSSVKKIKDHPDDAPFKLIQSIIFTRHQLVKYLYEPYFEDMIKGTFVRILLGEHNSKNIYRIARVKGVEEAKPYTVEDRGKNVTVTKALILSCGNDRVRGISKISNSKPLETEYAFWKQMTREVNDKIPKIEEVKSKITQIATLTKTYMYSEEDIEKMAKSRKRRIEDMDLSTLYRMKLEAKASLQEAQTISEKDKLNQEILDCNRAIKLKEEAMIRNRVHIANINRKNLEKNLTYEAPKSRKAVNYNPKTDPFERISSDSSFFDVRKKVEPVPIEEKTDIGESQSKNVKKLSKPDPSSKISTIHSFDIGIDINELPSPTTSSPTTFNTEFTRKREREPSSLTLSDYQSKRMKIDETGK